MSERERRGCAEGVTVRGKKDEAPTVSGYAAMFNEETVIAGFFREKIAPGAFAKAVRTDDVRALFNHDPNYVLGRTTNDTLTLSEDEKGLRYDVTLNPDDPSAMSVRAKIKRGDVTGSSFGFVVDEERWQEPEKGSRDLPLRTIVKASLFDVSPVTYPAYDATSVSARSQETATAVIDAATRAADQAELIVLEAQLAERRAWRV